MHYDKFYTDGLYLYMYVGLSNILTSIHFCGVISWCDSGVPKLLPTQCIGHFGGAHRSSNHSIDI